MKSKVIACRNEPVISRNCSTARSAFCCPEDINSLLLLSPTAVSAAHPAASNGSTETMNTLSTNKGAAF